MDLTFQFPVQYYFLQHRTLLPPRNNWELLPLWLGLFAPSVAQPLYSFCSSTSLFLLELLLHSSRVAYWTPTNLRASSFSIIFHISYCSWGSQGKNAEVVCHSLLQWTTWPRDPSSSVPAQDLWISSFWWLDKYSRQWRVQKRQCLHCLLYLSYSHCLCQLSAPIWLFLSWTSLHPYRRRQWHPTPVLLPGKSHGWRSLEGCSPWGGWGSDTTERLHFHFSLSCIGEGNGNPLQCSYLENSGDGGAWWAPVYGVAQSRTWLKWLSNTPIEIRESI